jgi:hypothetical protein
VSISFTCIATTGDPTDSDLAGLQSSLANATEVPNAEVKNLNVDTSANRRLSENTQGGGGRHLSAVNYTWVVTCDVEADLSDLGGISALEFESTVESNLNANSFERLLDLTVPSFTAMKEVTILLNTRQPTLLPTSYPTPKPTFIPTPLAGGNSSKKKSSTFTSSPIMITLIAVGGFVFLVLLYKLITCFRSESSHQKKLDKEISMRRASIKRAKAYSAHSARSAGATGPDNATESPLSDFSVAEKPLTEMDLAGLLGETEEASL